MKRYLLSLLFGSLAATASLSAADWPSWLGENMDATWRESGIIEDFNSAEPKTLWRTPAGLGYSGPTVAEGKVFVTDYVKATGDIVNNPGGKVELTGQERIRALDLKMGEEIWSHAYDETYFLSYPAGPRAVPTVADGKVYFLGAEGKFTCLNAATGEVLWSKDFQDDYGAETPIWGYASHPLVYDGLVYTLVGGEGSVVVAFDAETGEEKWKGLSATEIGYSPPSIIEAGGVKQLMVWHSDALNSLNPATGEVLWTMPLKPNYGMAVMAPRKVGDLLFASGIGRVGALYRLASDSPGAELEWKSTPKNGVYCANSTPFILGDVIYGCDTDTSMLTAVDLYTSDRLWETSIPTLGPDGDARARHGTAFLTYHEPTGMFYLFSETGELIIADLTRGGYHEVSRWKALEPTNEAFGRPVVWTAPAFAEKSVFLRNDKEIIRVDLSVE